MIINVIPERDDAKYVDGRWHVFTTKDTKWVENWAEFKEANGKICFSADQTQVELSLPEPYKFSITFFDNIS